MLVQVKASISYTICNFLQKGISFITVPIYIRLLTTAEYGEWSVFQSWSGILIIFASLNLYCGVYTKKLIDMPNEKERDRYTASMQGLGTTITIGLLLFYVLNYEWCNRIISMDTPFMLLLFLYFAMYPALSFWGTRQRVEYKYIPMVTITVLISILTPTVSILLLKYTNLKAKALILGFLLTQCIAGFIFYFYHFWKSKCFYDKAYWEYAIKFNIPLIPHYLSLIVLAQSDRIMIKYFCSNSDAGIYSFAYQIASAINLFISAIDASRVPWTYEQLKIHAYSRLLKNTNMLVVMMAGVTLLFCFISPEIIYIIGTQDYVKASYIIPIITLGVYFTFIYDIYASIEFYFGATKYVMYASFIGAVANIFLNAIFIPMFGFIAAAYTTLICYITLMLVHHIFAIRVLADQKISVHVYDDKFIFIISIMVVIACLISIFIFKYLTIRIAIIIFLIIFCYIKRGVIRMPY